MNTLKSLYDNDSSLVHPNARVSVLANWCPNKSKKAVAYIKLALSDDILNDVKGLRTAYEVWQKLKSTHENTTPMY